MKPTHQVQQTVAGCCRRPSPGAFGRSPAHRHRHFPSHGRPAGVGHVAHLAGEHLPAAPRRVAVAACDEGSGFEECGNRFAVASGLGSDQEDRITKSCVLGVDFGQRHTGLAISSTGGFAARPLKVLSRRLKPIDLLRMTADQVLGVALSEGADRIVVGMPVTLEGDINDNRTDSKHGRRCRNFAITLASKARPHGMKIFLCNEAGTTLGAVRSDSLGGLASSDLLSLEGADGEWLPRRLGAKNKKKAKKGCVDAKAAALLLQLYHRSPKTAIEVHPPEAS